MVADLLEQVVGGRALRDDVKSRLGEQPRDALPQQNRVVCDSYAHGISARTVVPLAGGLQTRSFPSTASTRSARPRSPEPLAGSAPPTPSSATCTTRCPLTRLTSTLAHEALAYFAMFV